MSPRITSARLLVLTAILVILAAVSGGVTVPRLASGSSINWSAPAVGHAEPVPSSSVYLGVEATITLPSNSSPDGVAVDSSTGTVFVTESQSNVVAVINGTSQQEVKTIPVGSNPSGVLYDRLNSEVYVSNFFGDDVKVINTSTYEVVANISVGDWPVGLTLDTANGNIYVADQSADAVTVISGATNKVLHAAIPVGVHPIADVFVPATDEVFVADSGSDNVTVIDASTGTVTGSIPVGATPLGVAYDPVNGNLYVSNRISNNTTVVNASTEKVVTSVALSPLPAGVAYDPSQSVIAVTAEGNNAVRMISDSTNTVVDSVVVGSKPVGIAYDPINDFMYVTNGNSSTLSVVGPVLPPPYEVGFTETGLPTGTSWSVTLSGTLQSSTSAVIAFSEPNGSYQFSVSPVPGYEVYPSTGSVTVDGFPVPVSITFTLPKYAVTFSESGLPAGTLWGITLNGTPKTTSNASMTVELANGTVPYTVVPPSGYSASPSSGNVTINGAPQTISITFHLGNTPPASSSPTSGTPLWVYLLVAAIIAVVVAGLAVFLRQRRPPAASATSPGATSPPTK